MGNPAWMRVVPLRKLRQRLVSRASTYPARLISWDPLSMSLIKNMGTKLDLRFNGKLTPEISPIFNKLSCEHRGQFNDLVSVMSLPYKDSLDWWVQGPASRNTFASPFFHYYCCLYFVRHLIEDGSFKFAEVVVDSRILKELIEKILRDRGIEHCKIRCDINFRTIIKQISKQYLSLPALLLKKLCQYVIARVTRKSSLNLTPVKPIVLIDTFIIPGYITYDRWYGSLWENLTDEMKAETFFVPTVVMTPLRSMYSTYKSLRLNSRNFIIKEDYLKIDDIIFAFQYKRRIKKVAIKPLSVFGYDISGLVQEELTTNRDVLTTIESILIYRFIKRLSQSGAKVRLAIDWFEGQVVDKAWNMALKKYYPNVKRIGYRAFESFPFYLCSYPILVERESGVIPDTIAVQGRGTVSTVREFLPDLDVIVIPSFKSQDVWECDLSRSDRSIFTVLIALPISIYTSARIVERLIEIQKSRDFEDKAIRYIVKPHPATSVYKIKKKLRMEIPDALFFSEETSFLRLLKEADLLITEASSTCLEALACGVPIIIMENEGGLTYDPVPNAIPKDLYRKTRTYAQLIDAMKYYVNVTSETLRQQKIYGLKIREDYFEPITKDGIERFMNIG